MTSSLSNLDYSSSFLFNDTKTRNHFHLLNIWIVVLNKMLESSVTLLVHINLYFYLVGFGLMSYFLRRAANYCIMYNDWYRSVVDVYLWARFRWFEGWLFVIVEYSNAIYPSWFSLLWHQCWLRVQIIQITVLMAVFCTIIIPLTVIFHKTLTWSRC